MAFGWCGLASTSGGRPGLFGGVGVVVVQFRVRVTAFGGCRGGCVPSEARGVVRSGDGYHGCMCGGGGGYCCGMVPSERGEAGALGCIWLIGRLSDFDVDVAEVWWHVEVVAASDGG